ncbi:hypothetical protein [Moorena producens]|nr:hypothetical protein [Moorena producens]
MQSASGGNPRRSALHRLYNKLSDFFNLKFSIAGIEEPKFSREYGCDHER